MSNQPLKKVKTSKLNLTKFELVHLRDLFSVLTPPEMKETLSQKLAVTQNRVLIEAKLWQKIVKSCEENDIPLGDDAPDFVVSLASTPNIGVYELSHDENQSSDETEESSIFETHESSHNDDDDDDDEEENSEKPEECSE